MKSELIIISMLLLVPAVAGCTSNQNNSTNSSSSMGLTSSAFSDGGSIPVKYAANGENISPPLSWSSAPANTRSYAVMCQDPDSSSGDFTHWIIFNIPAGTTRLNESIPLQGTLQDGAKQGSNDLGKIGYTGPNPPSGIHRYVFTVYALDSDLSLNPGANKNDFSNARKVMYWPRAD